MRYPTNFLLTPFMPDGFYTVSIRGTYITDRQMSI